MQCDGPELPVVDSYTLCRSPSGVSMTGVCNIGEADEVSACVWRIQNPPAPTDAEQQDQKPQYHIEF